MGIIINLNQSFMQKTIAISAMSALAFAIKLETETEASIWSLTKNSWRDDTTFIDKVLAGSGVFTDAEFPANTKTIGTPMGDWAKGTFKKAFITKVWKRPSQMFKADKIHMFSNKNPYST